MQMLVFFNFKIEEKRIFENKQSLKRYMASGSHCPIGFHLVIGCCDGAAAPVGADDLWYHTGQSWVYVSPFLRFYVNWLSERLSEGSRGPIEGSGGPSEGSGGPSEGSGGPYEGSGGLQGGGRKNGET